MAGGYRAGRAVSALVARPTPPRGGGGAGVAGAVGAALQRLDVALSGRDAVAGETDLAADRVGLDVGVRALQCLEQRAPLGARVVEAVGRRDVRARDVLRR